MRILIISDIHANLTALEAVLNDAPQVDAVWCLGDLVGYGPDPNECVKRVQQLPNLVCLFGNHDAAVSGEIDIASFNNEARQAVLWTQSVIEQKNIEYLRALDPQTVIDSVHLAHGSPRQPIWEYLLDTRTAFENFDYFQTPFCFVGHSHLPVVFQMENNKRTTDLSIPEANSSLEMIPRAIYNPGSVGQPRDRDPRAAYAVFDSDRQTWNLRRVPYDIHEVQERMRAAGLPQRHIQRLSAGW
jgi:diadenosine tetraphosphatase ApaH/serine/threonine PP2A family protein phosphatase